ncbi:MAG TPA: aldehyde dehydrogenase family protein [Saprospirales bacterium]|nr:aldehyde dehydrogenase family protein [Saprospirales bacterium]HAY70866.1 aldehyde dehydrogenase family protein [Saprospirales bacterium]HRQ29551.1 aldehyde dehydrogenase family protein [Saprospiraceae bacterium]
MEIKEIFEKQQVNKKELRSSDAAFRKKKLRLLEKVIMERREAFRQALRQDLNKSDVESDMTELFPVVSEIRFLRKHLANWMAGDRVPTPFYQFGGSSRIVYEPKGSSLIISPWNYPVNLSLMPLAGAIAAGNTIILKPSEFSPATTEVIKSMIQETFDEKEIAVVVGDAEVAKTLLELPFDHIFFTGSPAVGKLVMKAASVHLSSVTLELGGKSPVIVDETADIELAAKRIVWSKTINAGQTCIAPDFIMVHHAVAEKLIQALQKEFDQWLTEDGKNHPDMVRIINERHFDRLNALVDDAVERGAHLCSKHYANRENLEIRPNILKNVSPDAAIHGEEIFGPFLPVYEYESNDSLIGMLSEMPKPLALYIFSKSSLNKRQFVKQIPAGGVVVNHGLLHFTNPHLPFGGVNNSGLGSYHGWHSFLAFSHQKSVLNYWAPFSISDIFKVPYSPFMRKMADWIVKKL